MEEDVVKLRIAHAVLEEREKNNTLATEKALTIQATEYERRLGILNGEAERLRQIQSTYLPREVYDLAVKELGIKTAAFEVFMANYQGRGTVLTTLTSAGISIAIGLLFLYLNRGA